jgi:chain length determinant protein EpsF
MNIQQLFRILRARWLLILITFLVTLGTTIAISLMMPSKYTATAAVIVDAKGVDQISGVLLPMLPMSSYLATQVDIVRSHNVARKAVDLLKLAENPGAKELFEKQTEGRGNIRDWLAELLLKELDVEPSRESSFIHISYTGNDPRFAAAVANAFVRSYITTNLELKIAPARQTSAFFGEQIKTLQDNLENAQSKLSAYQRQHGIIATDERLDVENNRLNDLSSQLVLAQAQTYDALTRQRQVTDFVAKGQVPDTLPDVLANPVIQGLKANLTALEAKQNELTSKVGKNHPSYQAVAAEIDGVQKQLLVEMRTISATLGNAAALAQKREDQIRASLAAQRGKVLEMKKVRDDLTVLLREVENTQRAYDGAQGRMTQTKLESQHNQTNVTVINEAIEPIEPSSPRIFLNIAFSIVIGVFLAVGLALLRELFDRTVRSDEELAAMLGMPVLGVITPDKRRWGRRNAGIVGAGAR